MKKILSVFLCALVLLSCLSVVAVADDAPLRVIVTSCDSVNGWGNNDAPFEVSNIPTPQLNAAIDPDNYGVVAYHYTGAIHVNGGWGRENVTTSQGVKISYSVPLDATNEAKSIDLTGTNYMIIDIYVSNAAVLSDVDLYLELTSSGSPDKQEICWRRTLPEFKNGELVDGWNHFEIALDSHTEENAGGCNFAAWNYLRIYNATAFDAGDGLTIAFRNFYFSEVSPLVEATKAAAASITALFAPIADVTAGSITADNYETVKTASETALAAYNAAEPTVQAFVGETYDVVQIESAVALALETYEEELNKPAEPETPAEPDAPVEPDAPTPDEPTEPETPDEPDAPAEKDGLNPVVIVVIAAAVVAAVVAVIIVAKKKK